MGKRKSVIDKENRGKLGEGRNYGMGFAFCKKIDNYTFQTVQPISPCKDYLNEPVYTEATGKQSSAFGLTYSKKGIFEGQDYGYLAIKIMPYSGGGEYPDYKKHKENINKNYLNIQKLLSIFEKELKIKGRTKIYKCADGETFLLYVPKTWLEGTYLISLYSLLARLGQFYTGENALEFVKNFKAFSPDSYLASTAFTKIEKIKQLGELPKQKMEGMGCPHNVGIVGYNF